MATHIRCYRCRNIFDIKLTVCPDCDTVRRGFSEHLHKSKLDNHLFRQAESADDLKRKYRAVRQGYQIPPTKAQRAAARQIVADL